MKHLQKAPRKPLFNEKQGDIFITHLDGVLDKKMAHRLFVEGMTNEEVAELFNYSKRQIDRIRVDLMKAVLKKLIEKRIPKKPLILGKQYVGVARAGICKNCSMTENSSANYCRYCGQALDWSDTE